VNKALNSKTVHPISSIQSISTGLEKVVQNPWALLFPFLMDLFLWIGPRLGLSGSLVDNLIAAMTDSMLSSDANFQNFLDTYSANAGITTEKVLEYIRYSMETRFNLFDFLAVFPFGMPSLVSQQMPPISEKNLSSIFDNLTPLTGRMVWAVHSKAELLLFVCTFLVMGLVLFLAFINSMSHSYRQTSGMLWVQIGRFIRVALSVLLFAMLASVIVFVGLLILSILGIAVGVNPAIISILFSFVLLWISSLAMVYGTLTLPAMLITDFSIIKAFGVSITLTRQNTFQVILFYSLSIFIYIGTKSLFLFIQPNQWAFVISLIAHAFIVCMLTLALFHFYESLFRKWESQQVHTQTVQTNS